jgi:hypothetical protein
MWRKWNLWALRVENSMVVLLKVKQNYSMIQQFYFWVESIVSKR